MLPVTVHDAHTQAHTHTFNLVQEACDICSLSGGLLVSSTSAASFLSTWEGEEEGGGGGGVVLYDIGDIVKKKGM